MQIDKAADLSALSVDDAERVLSNFLEVEREYISNILPGDCQLEYTESSVISAINAVSDKILNDGDDNNIDLWCMRLGYYFGESMCRLRDGLVWGIGERDSAFENHPIVRGFAGGFEAAVISICRNLILAVVFDRVSRERIDVAIRYWFKLASEG